MTTDYKNLELSFRRNLKSNLSFDTESPKKRKLSFDWKNPVDYEEQEKKETKNLYLCIRLINSDKIVIKVNRKTTAKNVISTAMSKISIRKLYRNFQIENLELSLASVKTSCGISGLPKYFQIYRLHKLGLWTHPNTYPQYPVLALQAKTRNSYLKKIPDLSAGVDPLISKDIEWCSNSDEASNFRLKYNCLFSEIKSSDGVGRYPQFIDSYHDPKIFENKSIAAYIIYRSNTVSKFEVQILRSMKLEHLMISLREKLQKTKVELHVDMWVLKFAESSEYIWNPRILLFDVDGIRESILQNLIPELELIPRPACLNLDNNNEISGSFEDTSKISSVNDDIEISQFQRNSMKIMIPNTPNADVGRNRPKTVHFINNGKSRMKKRTSKRFSVIKSLVPISSKVEPLTEIDVRQLHTNFRIKIMGIENLKMYSFDEESQMPLQRLHPTCITVEALLYTGCATLDSQKVTSPIALASKNIFHSYNENIRWGEWLDFSINYAQLPLATTIKFVIKCWVSSKPSGVSKQKVLGWVNFRIFCFAKKLKTGIHRLGILPYYTARDSTGSSLQNKDPDASQLYIQLDKFLAPVEFGDDIDSDFNFIEFLEDQKQGVSSSDEKELTRIINESPLYEMCSKDKKLVWRYRAYLSTITHALPKLLLSVDWCDPQGVRDIYHLLDLCPIPESVVAIELLDGKFSDPKVRDFAVRALEKLNNYELHQYLIQLVQALKFEAFHDSSLARFLLSRALKSPESIGHTFFWLLRSEMTDAYSQERFGLLLEQYLRKCGSHRNSLVWEDHLMKSLEKLAWFIQKSSEKREVLLNYMHDELNLLNEEMPEFYTLPFNSKILVTKIKTEECKFMKSKKKPLYIVLKNAEKLNEDYHILFKVGDDMRQDMLTLQVLKVMDHLWMKSGINLGMSLYKTLALGNNVGILEVVRNAETLGDIHRGGACLAFCDKTLYQWLNKQPLPSTQDNFIKSCAGYCVATYVLGIADRHNDNIMVKNAGHLFHIDFGHFLGHFKRKLGIKRETAPFAFTPDMVYVMGGKKSKGYERFNQICAKAFNILRKNKNLLISLFTLMLCSGIQELTRDDLKYLNKTLIDIQDEKAEKLFRNLIKKSLNDPMTRINFSIHILAN